MFKRSVLGVSGGGVKDLGLTSDTGETIDLKPQLETFGSKCYLCRKKEKGNP